MPPAFSFLFMQFCFIPVDEALDVQQADKNDVQRHIRKRTARVVLTGMCYSVGNAMR